MTRRSGRWWAGPRWEVPGRALVAVLAGVAAGVLVMAGCGVPAEHRPRDVPTRHQPFPVPHTPVPSATGVGAMTEPLYFVRDGTLVRVLREVPAWPTVETQLRHLLAGPDRSERRAGLSSALTGTTSITGVRLSGGQATVEITDNPEDPGRNDEILAYGQIVCTLTIRPDITGATFERDGRRLDVPRADGSLTQTPLSAADYDSLIAR